LTSQLILGKPFQEKLTSLRKDLSEKKATAMIISMLDEVAWLFNLRGSDIDYNPVFFAYALVTPESSTLYINENKLTKEVFILDGFRIHSEDFIYHPR
jgi:Xaa-Pro aminopeptidase